MRSSAALLLAVALSASAVPLPKKETKPANELSARGPEVLNVWKHRHFDSAVQRRDSDDEPHRAHGEGHWTNSGTWAHSHTGSWSHSATTVASQPAAPLPTANSVGQNGNGHPFPWKKCGTTTTDSPTTDPTTSIPQTTETSAPVTDSTPPQTSTAPPVTSSTPPAETTPAPTTDIEGTTTVTVIVTTTMEQPPPPPSSTPPPPPQTTTQAPAPPASTQAASSPNAQAYLDPHNTARAAHGANPVTWDDNLAALAQQWVNGCKFEHSGGSLSSDFGYGENLAAGTGEYPIADAVTSWVNEGSTYDYNNPGFSMDTGHFTQVVWKSTTAIGCAYQDCPNAGAVFPNYDGNWRIHSCMYTPPGNMEGDYPNNVSAN